jgi:hypothetical protein
MASMNNLEGQPGEIRMTIQIKRAATGETETHELVGKVMDEVKEQSDVGNAQYGST